jgi:hypothetical protein
MMGGLVREEAEKQKRKKSDERIEAKLQSSLC